MGNSRRRIIGMFLAAVWTALLPVSGWAADRAELEELRREIQDLRRRDADKQRQIDVLKSEVQQLHQTRSAAAPGSAIDQAVQEAGAPAAEPAKPVASGAPSALDRAVGALASPPGAAPGAPASTSLYARKVGTAEIRLLDISFVTLLAVGGSTARDAQIAELEGGAHDPKRRGFTLQQGELSLIGAIDPYFTAESHIVYTTGGVELEEAFFTTTSLPANLQLKGGYFFTEFGRINPTHPHAWDWLDQPVVNTRMFGGDGLRSPGARLGWLTPLPWFSEVAVGVQNANEGELTTSFMGEDGVGGRPVVKTAVGSVKDMLYLTRWNNSWNWNDSLTTVLGLSGLFGPNSSGTDGRTYLYGADMTWKWQPPDHFRGWPFLTWQSEVMRRDYRAAGFVAGTAAGDGGDGGDDSTEDVPGDHLHDWGLYTQLLWGFRHGWAAGVRYEYATGSGPSLDGGRQNDFLRDDRQRVSPLIVWQPSEYSRIRLQYDFDHAEFLSGKDAHSVWMGFEVLYGAHPAHQY
jgi:hypothetical protein